MRGKKMNYESLLIVIICGIIYQLDKLELRGEVKILWV